MVRYQEVADDLRAKILNETYPPGQPLPHSQLLAIEYGVSNSTISQALKTLKDEQLVIRNPTEGMIVQPPATVVDLILHGTHGHGPLPWAACCERSGTQGKMVTGKVATSKAAPDVAELLGLDDGDEVITRHRHATVGDDTVRLDEAIYPLAYVRDTPLAKRGQVPGGVYQALTDAGLEPRTIVRRVIANRHATDEEAKALHIVKRSLVLTYDQVIADREGTRIELLRFVANPARVRFMDEQVPL
ncbi:GntR family transcriptional regulator [Nonomuraea sp. NPDC049784]|uniref:GntR family transcriptional regulator n=1 Tax=Nonomuraea sp. NPDC049784 TaxID=3154361 RepID=UPI0033F118C5